MTAAGSAAGPPTALPVDLPSATGQPQLVHWQQPPLAAVRWVRSQRPCCTRRCAAAQSLDATLRHAVQDLQSTARLRDEPLLLQQRPRSSTRSATELAGRRGSPAARSRAIATVASVRSSQPSSSATASVRSYGGRPLTAAGALMLAPALPEPDAEVLAAAGAAAGAAAAPAPRPAGPPVLQRAAAAPAAVLASAAAAVSSRGRTLAWRSVGSSRAPTAGGGADRVRFRPS